MRYQEIGYSGFLALLQDKYIVCVGLGKLFLRYRHFFADRGLGDRVIALVDNDERKHGMQIELAGKVYHVKNLDELVSIRQDYKFLVMIRSEEHTSELQSQR